jgi:hypothetical protein
MRTADPGALTGLRVQLTAERTANENRHEHTFGENKRFSGAAHCVAGVRHLST